MGEDNLKEQEEKFKNGCIIELYEIDKKYTICTKNLMGFIKINSTQIHVNSRFTSNEYFLYYMLENIFDYNIFDCKTDVCHNDILDFLPFLFPLYFMKAVKDGIYKEYVKKEYNNSRPKGVIDIKKHAILNPIFNAKIAYKTREHSYNNKVTQLIRHTIEFIKEKNMNILFDSNDLQENIAKIYSATFDYKRSERESIIKANYKNINHSYYTEYEDLKNLCLKILRFNGVAYDNNNDDEIEGILFNAGWLWENYLFKILKLFTKFKTIHHNLYNLFNEVTDKKIQPDFIININGINIVADAKYKWLTDNATDDIYQVITYMLYSNSCSGFLLYPYAENCDNECYTFSENLPIANNFKIFAKLGLKISINKSNYNDFKREMNKNEYVFLENIIAYHTKNSFCNH